MISKALDRKKSFDEKLLFEEKPWGSYTILDEDDGYKVKRIEVQPGHRLSLQKHLHRSEYWVVVSGKAHVQCGEKLEILEENDNIFIPLGQIHRVENAQDVPLVFIEVQSGDYCEEDDIIRIEDDYSR